MESSTMNRAMLHRTELLVGTDAVNRISAKRVIIFGVGGVGSWCAESLVRSGVRHLTIVDSDRVCITNCNRQLIATSSTIGQVKVEVLKARLLDVCPSADITALQQVYEAENAASFHLETYDYVIDAIDSLQNKAHLILYATNLSRQIKRGELKGEGVVPRLTFVSSMGAALRVDPTQIRVAEFWKVKNDALGKALRKRFKYRKEAPATKFQCVYSEEPPMQNRGEDHPYDTDFATDNDTPHNPGFVKTQINGTMSHVTAIFGFTIAGLVVQDMLAHS